MSELLQERSVFREDINVATDRAGGGYERRVDDAAEILKAEDGVAGRKAGVCDGLNELEGVVVDVDLVVGVVGGKQHISGWIGGDRQSRVGRTRSGDGDQGGGAIHRRRPAADGAVESGEYEGRLPSANLELCRISVEHDTGGGTGAIAARRGNQNVERHLGSVLVVERGPAGGFVADPPWAALSVSEAPGIYQEGIGCACCFFLVRD